MKIATMTVTAVPQYACRLTSPRKRGVTGLDVADRT